MTTLNSTKVLLAAALIVGGAAAFAQTSGTTGTTNMPGTVANQPNTAVGVTPATAAEANRQAVPGSNTGTVVRTSPSATDATRNATGMGGSMSDTTTSRPMRTARADRN